MPRQSILSDKAAFAAAAQSTSSIREFLEVLGLRAAGGNFKQAHKWSAEHGIPLPKSSGSETIHLARAAITRPDDEVFCENSDYINRAHMKKRLKEQGWEQVCSVCGLGDEWNSKPLVLQLDHINGIHNDNRKENLRLLCPNCHSQTDTFCTKNLK